MKNFIATSFLLSVFITSVFAQSSEILKVRLDENDDKGKPMIINVRVQAGTEISGALFVEFPAGLKPVLHSAKLDDKALWLINNKTEISKDNVIGWYKKDNGLMLHYNGSITKNNAVLQVEVAPLSNRLERFDQIEIKIYPVLNSGPDRTIQKSVLAKTNLSVKKVD